jgi:hypothetical protein
MRIIVAGGRGFFGRTVVQLLSDQGFTPLVGSRGPGADISLNLEDEASLRAVLQRGDILIDTVGPYQDRSTKLIEAAIEIGFDCIDLSDSIAYVRKVWCLKPRIDAAGIRVFTACSSMSALSAALVYRTGMTDPMRVSGFIAPSSRYAANSATGESLLRSVGQPIEVLYDRSLVTRVGWLQRRTIDLPLPVGRVRGHLFETVDSFLLPMVWPSIAVSDFYVDSRVPGLNMAFTAAAYLAPLRRLMQRYQSLGLTMARRFGAIAGGLGYEIEGVDGRIVRFALATSDRAYRIAAAPAVLAARSIASDRQKIQGLLPCDQLVAPHELFRYLAELGIHVEQLA